MMTLNTLFFISIQDKVKATNSKLNKLDMRVRQSSKGTKGKRLEYSYINSTSVAKKLDILKLLTETETAKANL